MGSRGVASRSSLKNSANSEIINELKHYVSVNGENTIKGIASRAKADVSETSKKITQIEKKIASKSVGSQKKETLRKELIRQKHYLNQEQKRLDAVKELGWD